MKIKTILFDLDDTLLGNNMDTFIPRYFSLLGEYARPLFGDSRQLLKELLIGTEAMVQNTDPALTNREVFWQVFLARTGLDPEETEKFFNRFYEEHFPQLEAVTSPRPVAVKVVEVCLEQGLQVAIATNPLFPRRAIEHRLAWAGLPVSEYDFALVTSYETMHAAKPHRAYYQEILERLDAHAKSTLMVGDDWQNDIQPAAALGMTVYWIAPEEAQPPDQELIAGHGSLEAFYRRWMAAGRSGA